MQLRVAVQMGFLGLVAGQSVHSIEEAAARLWEVWGPAATISGLISDNLALGFAVVNSALVLFGFWCYAYPIRNSAPSAIYFLWFWTLLEFANSIFHLLMSIGAGGYFPGAVSAPLLLFASLFVAIQLLRGVWNKSAALELG